MKFNHISTYFTNQFKVMKILKKKFKESQNLGKFKIIEIS